jgi:UDP-N-acetylmuramate--alanine ligase
MNLNKIKTIHFTGIKGVGMTALALCAQDMGFKITSSDTNETFPSDQILKKRGFKIKTTFSPTNLPNKLDLLIYTGAHGGVTNKEVIAAKNRQVPCLNLAQGLKLFTQSKKVLAVAGVGGKSTTSAMLSVVLESAGLKPSFAVGVGNITGLNVPGRLEKNSPWFVVEADEYVSDPQADRTPRFHYLDPYLAIITNVEHDHPDVYPDLDSTLKAYQQFLAKVPRAGAIIINLDHPNNKRLIKLLDQPVITYGFSPQSDWQITKTHVADKKQFMEIKANGIDWPQMTLNVPGQYNALNAVSVVAACNHLGLSANKIQTGLSAFIGSKRRFEYIDTVKGIDLYDDYAHHPVEIKALLKAAKSWLPGKRIFAIFESHTYSRTKTFLTQFCQSFQDADYVLINDIFSSARETNNLGMTGEVFTNELKKHYPQVHYCPAKSETINFLIDHVTKNDVIFTIGAGNNWLWHKDIIKALSLR